MDTRRRSESDACVERALELGRLLDLWPRETADVSIQGRLLVIKKLQAALRNERRRGASGHWSYDLGRHRRLSEAWRRELAALREVALAQATRGTALCAILRRQSARPGPGYPARKARARSNVTSE
jgi:hypothetical protein